MAEAWANKACQKIIIMALDWRRGSSKKMGTRKKLKIQYLRKREHLLLRNLPTAARNCSLFLWDHPYPKDPSVLKMLRYDDSKNSELLRRSVFTTPPKFTTPWTLLAEEECLYFPGKWCPRKLRCDSKSPRRTKNTMRSKFTTRSIFSTAGSFG